MINGNFELRILFPNEISLLIDHKDLDTMKTKMIF